ncbi:hypothetical protein BOY45_004079 [Shigella flexneri]|nr:hypothetical protein [Shigella flexneri]
MKKQVVQCPLLKIIQPYLQSIFRHHNLIKDHILLQYNKAVIKAVGAVNKAVKFLGGYYNNRVVGPITFTANRIKVFIVFQTEHVLELVKDREVVLRRLYLHRCLVDLDTRCLVDLDTRCLVDLDTRCLVDLDYRCLVDLDYRCLVVLDYRCPVALDYRCPVDLDYRCLVDL